MVRMMGQAGRAAGLSDVELPQAVALLREPLSKANGTLTSSNKVDISELWA